jgi:hypothetical protein
MARGWESKSIEDQINAVEAKEDARVKEAVSASDMERRKRKESLLLERTRLEREIRTASKRRHLVMLERALTHIEAELAKLE